MLGSGGKCAGRELAGMMGRSQGLGLVGFVFVPNVIIGWSTKQTRRATRLNVPSAGR